jgi:hypothetical protein
MASIPLDKRVLDLTVAELLSVLREHILPEITKPPKDNFSTRKINLKQLLKIYPWPQQTVYGWVNENYIPHSKVGRHLMFDLDVIEKWIESYNVDKGSQRKPKV